MRKTKAVALAGLLVSTLSLLSVCIVAGPIDYDQYLPSDFQLPLLKKPQSVITEEPVYQSYEAQCPLPKQFHIKNRGGIDGAGLCVWATINHAAHWQNINELKTIFEYMGKQPGGGWPGKVDKYLKGKFNFTRYVQAEGMENVLPLLEYAANTNRMACITYGWDRSGAKIAHMVNCVFFGEVGCALDNNHPRTWEWMTKEELLRRIRSSHLVSSGDASWIIVFLDDPPPPVPGKIID